MAAGKRNYEPTEREYIHDRPDPARPERPCACCGKPFQPTIRRRMLCDQCFGGDEAMWRAGDDMTIADGPDNRWRPPKGADG